MSDNYVSRCIKAQNEYCEKTQSPRFAPTNGICYSCKRQIYGKERHNLEKAQSELITGCSRCHYSFVG